MTKEQRKIIKWLSVTLGLVVLCACGWGAYYIAPWKIVHVMWSGGEGYAVLLYVRLPRVALGALVGAVLAMTGASMQGMFRNPLAEPGLLGLNAGAGLGAALWIVFVGIGVFGLWGIAGAAFVCTWGVTWLAWRLSHASGRVLVSMLLLAGIAMNSFAAAGIGLMTFVADEQQLRSITFWLLGGLGGATWPLVGVTALFIAVGGGLQLRFARALNLMTFGETEAFHMGVDTEHTKRFLILGATLGVSAAVAASGSIGFIGLVVPHLLRMWGGPDHRFLLPASAIGGAILLVLSDLVARTIVMPTEIPVGIVTALIGAPFLVWLLLRGKEKVLYA